MESSLAAINATSRTGIGWRGPYLKSESGVNWLIDGWGRDFVYNGDAATPYLLSYGADGVVGGSGTAADIQIDFPATQRISNVSGVINRNSLVFDGDATVKLYTADGTGALETTVSGSRRSITLAAGDNGAFTFTDVPMGLRSFTVSFPSLTDVIGPAFIPIDKPKYQIPHNYLDSAPGQMPHLCSDINNYSYVTGSITRSYKASPSPGVGRIYFELNVTQSVTISSLYVMSTGGLNFRAIRIGNVEKDCNDEIECYSNRGSRTSPDLNENISAFYPEMNLKRTGGALPWTIPIGRLGGYVEFVGDPTIPGPDGQDLELRLGCRIVNIQ